MKLRFTSFNFLFFFLLSCLATARGYAGDVGDNSKSRAKQWVKSQPVRFLENKGQMTDMNGRIVPFVLFKASAPGMDMYITEKGLTYVMIKAEEEEERREEHPGGKENSQIEWTRIDMDLKGASIKRENIIPQIPSVTDFNYFLAHCPDGIHGVKEYEKIIIKDIYPGIDWQLYNSSESGFKYDFIVHPGADPAQIKLLYRSEEKLNIDKEGNIRIKTNYGDLTENAPVSYIEETQESIETKFVKTAVSSFSPDPQHSSGEGYETEISFGLSAYYPSDSRTLVIDPQLVWGTFYGGSSGYGGVLSVDCDVNGNVFAVGYLTMTGFPVYNPGGGAYFQGTGGGSSAAFILKFSNGGVRLWATFYGGGSGENTTSVACDKNTPSNVYVTGWTWGGAFPLQSMAGAYNNSTFVAPAITFLLKFDNAGSRLWATYYPSGDSPSSVFCDNANNVYMAGYTWSTNFLTQSASQPTFGGGSNDGFLTKFDAAGALQWSTYFGGSGDDKICAVTCDNNVPANVFVTGYTVSGDLPVLNAHQPANAGGTSDAFIAKFNNTGVLQWSTYYGGNGEEQGHSVVCSSTNKVFVLGFTTSAACPTLDPGGGAYYDNTLGGTTFPKADALILRFANAGTLEWATYYGGNDVDANESDNTFDNLVVDGCNNIYVSFNTRSSDMPVLNPGCGFFDATLDGGKGYRDIYIAKFSLAGVHVWSSYFGGTGADFRGPMAVDGNNGLFVAGEWAGYTTSVGSNLPLADPGGGAYYVSTPPGTEIPFIAKLIPEPLALSTDTSLFCPCSSSATVTPTCSPPYTYVWNTSPVQNTQIATGLCVGNYTVTVTSAECVTQTAVVPIVCVSCTPPVVTLSGINTLCTGNSTTLTASGASTYTWSPATGLSATNISNPVANPAVTTTYTVIGNPGPCPDTAVVTVTVTSVTAGISVAPSLTICSGSSVTLHAVGGGTYSWSTGQTTTDIIVSPTTNTAYTTTASVNGCTATKTKTVTVNPLPVANAGPDISMCAGSNTTLNGSGNGTYNWSPSTGLSCTTCANPVSSTTANTSYTLTVTNSCGMATDVVDIFTPALPSASAGAPATICAGNSAILSGSGSGTFVWSPSTGLSCVSCPNPVATPTATTTYTLSISASCGTNTDSVKVTVTPTLIVAISGASTVCSGNTATLSASGGGAYLWSPSGDTTASILVNPTSVSVYSVTATNNGCSGAATQTITVSPLPNANAGPDVSICAGDSTMLNGSGSGLFTWSPGGSLSCTGCISPVATPTATTTYTLSVTNNCGTAVDSVKITTPALPSANAGLPKTICAGSSVTLTGSGSGTFVWSPSMGLSCTSCANPVATPTSNTTYTLTINASCGTNTDSVKITVNSVPVVSIGGINTVCAGQNATLSASGGGNYLWSNGSTASSIIVSPTTTSGYSVSVSNGSCSSAASVSITVSALPSAVITGNITLCAGDIATLTASGGNSYAWSTGSTNSVITVNPISASTYTVVAANASGCTASATVNVTVSAPPTATASNATICTGQTATIAAGGGGSYSWNTGSTNASVAVSPPSTSTYTVIVSVGSCKDTANSTVTVVSSPTAGVGSSVTITAGSSTTITASGGGNYMWSNGSTDALITVSPSVTTGYCVSVTNGNCIDTACMTVFVEEDDCSDPGVIYLPNAFSPNDDGENDRIKIYFQNLLCIQTFDLIIYNRWGEKVFETDDPAGGWNGIYKDKPESAAVYAWYMKAGLVNGTKVERKGNVSLVR